MPINRYEVPSLTLDYQPLPYDDILKAGLLKDQRVNQNLGMMKPLGLDSIEEHDPYRMNYVKNFNQQASQLIDKYKDPGSADFSKGLKELVYSNANNPYIEVLKRSKENKKEWSEKVGKLQSEGKYAYWRDPEYLRQEQFKLFKEGKAPNPYLNPDGSPKEFSSTYAGEAQDWNKPVMDLFDKMKEDGSFNDVTAPDENGNLVGKKKGWEGITKSKMMREAIKQIPSFLHTAAGRDFIEKQRFDHPGISNEDILKAAADHMETIADLYIHGKSTTGSDFHYGPDDLRKILNERQVTHTDTPVNALDLGETPEIKFKDGKPVVEDEYSSPAGAYTVGPMGAQVGSPINPKKFTPEQRAAREQEANKFIQDIQKTFPQLKGLSPEQAYKSYTEAKKNFSKQASQDINPSGEWKKSMIPDLVGDMFTRSSTLEGGNGKMFTLEGDGGVMEQLGYNPSDEADRKVFKEAVESVKIQPKGPHGGDFVIQVPDKKEGITKRIYIKPDAEQQQSFLRTKMLSEGISELIKNPSTTVNPINIGGATYIPKVEFDKNTNSFIPKVVIVTPNGETHETNLDEISASDERTWKKSPFLGSNLTTSEGKKK